MNIPWNFSSCDISAQLVIRRQWKQWIPTTPHLGHEPETDYYEEDSLAVILLDWLSTVCWNAIYDVAPIRHWFARSRASDAVHSYWQKTSLQAAYEGFWQTLVNDGYALLMAFNKEETVLQCFHGFPMTLRIIWWKQNLLLPNHKKTIIVIISITCWRWLSMNWTDAIQRGVQPFKTQ